ncbi:MAG TPA: GvpL/GvpF family gas vesicle protein [Thermoanaerobaculia bacterium]|nr:GvpL/GvpF family gas vesicle protein [Thermoanaerobaculia bacterium]
MTEATYLYCLVRDDREPSFAGVPPGLPGCSPPRALGLGGGLWLVAATAPLSQYGSEQIQSSLSDLSWVSDRALAHEAVIEHFASSRAVLPLKLFTLFGSDERALADVRQSRERIDRSLDQVEGCVEWGVRIRVDDARAREILAEEARLEAGRQASGTAFLLRKKLEQEASRNLASRLRAEMDEVFAELAEGARDTVRREAVTPPEAGGRLLLDAAFLVPTVRGAEFEARVERCAARLATRGCEVTLTGPWPPYHFVEEAR